MQRTIDLPDDIAQHLDAYLNAMYDEIQAMIFSLPQWRGSLEDATVAITALRYRCPIGTLNFRDFAVFKNLEFWNSDPND
jgi:predicted nucleic acid-binding protein